MAEGGTLMMRAGIVSLCNRLCASNLCVRRQSERRLRQRGGQPWSGPCAGAAALQTANAPMAASERKVVLLPVRRDALEDLYGRKVVALLLEGSLDDREEVSEGVRGRARQGRVGAREEERTLMPSMKVSTFAWSSSDGKGLLMTLIGTLTVGESGVANLLKLTCGAADESAPAGAAMADTSSRCWRVIRRTRERRAHEREIGHKADLGVAVQA